MLMSLPQHRSLARMRRAYSEFDNMHFFSAFAAKILNKATHSIRPGCAFIGGFQKFVVVIAATHMIVHDRGDLLKKRL